MSSMTTSFVGVTGVTATVVVVAVVVTVVVAVVVPATLAADVMLALDGDTLPANILRTSLIDVLKVLLVDERGVNCSFLLLAGIGLSSILLDKISDDLEGINALGDRSSVTSVVTLGDGSTRSNTILGKSIFGSTVGFFDLVG